LVAAASAAPRGETREQLLRAAEALFAEQGIDNTSVREINRRASQKNTSAVRYHFGSLEGLLATLIEERMGALDEARREALEGLEGEGATALEVSDYVGVLILPLVDHARRDEGWANWIRVLGQLISVRGQEHRPLWEGRFDETTRSVLRRIRSLGTERAAAEWQQCVADFMMFSIGSIRERVERQALEGTAGLSDAAYRRHLVGAATALLTHPASSD